MPSPLRRADVGALLEQRAHRVAIAVHRRIGDRRRRRRGREPRGHRERGPTAQDAFHADLRRGSRKRDTAQSSRGSQRSILLCVLGGGRRGWHRPARTRRCCRRRSSMSSMPSSCISGSMTFAIGVPSSALRCTPPFSCAVGVAEQRQRAAAMVVDVRIGHRRSPDNHRLVEQAGVAVHRGLHLVEEIGELARRGTCRSC